MTKQKHFFLFRGLIREGKHWADFPGILANAFPGSKVSAIDIPGAGEHLNSPSPLSIKKMVEEMRRDYQSHRSENDECFLVAISLGGMISAQWLKDYPEDFLKAILINTSYGGISPIHKRLRPEALLHILKVPTLKGRDREAHILRLVSNHKDKFDKTLNLWDQIHTERPVSLSNTLRQLGAAFLFRIGNFKPNLPILVLASTQDRMVSVDCSRAIAQKWDAPIHEHPTAGHDLSVDDSEWVVQKVKDFLN